MILNFNCMDAAFLPEELHFGDTIVEWYWSTCVQGYGGCLFSSHFFVSDCTILLL